MNSERNKLDVLCGHWKGQGIIHPNPWTGAGPTEASWWFRWDDAKVFLLCDCTEQQCDQTVFHAHGVLGIDLKDGTPYWWWFDSYGFLPTTPARGAWDGDVLQFVKETPRGAGRTSFAVIDQNLECAVESRTSSEEAFSLVMSGAFSRVD